MSSRMLLSTLRRFALLVFAICLFAPETKASSPDINTTLSSDNIFWIEAPNIEKTLMQFKESEGDQRGSLLHHLLGGIPWPETKASSSAILALFRGAKGTRLEPAFWLAAKEASPSLADAIQKFLLKEGFSQNGENHQDSPAWWRFLRGDENLWLWWGKDRLGLVESEQRMKHALLHAPQPLADSKEYQQLAKDFPRVALRYRFDWNKYYGFLARNPDAAQTIGVIERLGLSGAQHTLGAMDVAQKGKNQAVTLIHRANVSFKPGEPKGLRKVLGPPLEKGSVLSQSDKADVTVQASVYPRALYQMVLLVSSYVSPMETTLLRTQLDALEAQAGHTIGSSILGDAPQVWTLDYFWENQGERFVLYAPIANAPMAQTLLGTFSDILKIIGSRSQMTVQKKQLEGSTFYVFSSSKSGKGQKVMLGTFSGALLIGNDEKLLVSRLKAGESKAKKSTTSLLDITGSPSVVAVGNASSLILGLKKLSVWPYIQRAYGEAQRSEVRSLGPWRVTLSVTSANDWQSEMSLRVGP